MSRIKEPIFPRALRSIVKDYQETAFPDWDLMWGSALVRRTGPVLQQIGFESLRSGEYRPMGSVRVLVVPDGGGLDRFLNIKDRSVLPEHHASKISDVVQAIHQEFIPSVSTPLNAENVLDVYAAESAIQSADALAIAGLAAFLGRYEVADEWCNRLETLTAGEDLPAWKAAQRDFGQSIQVWIQAGTIQGELTQIMEQEQQKLRLK